MDLIETSKLMREQDNRGTQYPLFVIQEEVESTTANGRGDKTVYFCNEHGDSYTMESEEYEKLEQAKDKLIEVDEAVQTILDNYCIETIEDFDPYEWERLEISVEWRISDRAGVFFTEKACHAHIEENKHHYTKPRSYVISAWRNNEMVAVMQMILKLTGDDIPSHYL